MVQEWALLDLYLDLLSFSGQISVATDMVNWYLLSYSAQDMSQLGLVPAADKICFHWDLISIVSRHFGSNHIGSNHFIVVRTCGGWGVPKGGWNLEYSTALLPTQRRFLAAVSRKTAVDKWATY